MRCTEDKSTARGFTGGNFDKPEGAALGITLCRLEWGSVRTGIQPAGEGGFSENPQGGRGLKGSGTARTIQIALLNIRLGGAGSLEAAL